MQLVPAMQAFVRLALCYAALFAALGAYMQFFPVWLHVARGLEPAAVTAVLSWQIWARTPAGPFWSQRVDRTGDPRRVMTLLTVLSLLVLGAFTLARDQAALVWCSIAFGCVFSPQFAILDGYAVHCATALGFSFGRLRMWGSLSFLCVIAVVGHALQLAGERRAAATPDDADAVMAVLLGAGALAVVCAWRLPTVAMPRATGKAPIWLLLRQPPFLLFLLATGLIGGSHGAYYALSTLHWRHHGVGDDVASWLWGEGIVAEIVVFFAVRGAVERQRPTTLMLLGAGGAVVRWCVLGVTTEPWLIALVNWLHAASFGLTFLGSLRFIRTRVAPELQSTAQGLLGAASSGIATAIATQIAGPIYDRCGGGVFFVMSGFALAGGLVTYGLRRRRLPS